MCTLPSGPLWKVTGKTGVTGVQHCVSHSVGLTWIVELDCVI